MESTSSAEPRFRFRDHGDDESSEGHTSGDSSSVSTNEDEDSELQSMAAKGVQHLCSELVELKQESDEDFRKHVLSNFPAFLAILKEVDVLQAELAGLEQNLSSHKKVVKDFSSLRVLSRETMETMLDDPLHITPWSPSILETHTETISDVLDTLISEYRLDDAVVLLEMEGKFFQNLQSGEHFSSDAVMSYNTAISEKRAVLLDLYSSAAKHCRVSSLELQQALGGLCRLGETHLATQLLFQSYHSHIVSGIASLQSKELLNPVWMQEAAKLVCSMICQAGRSFEALNDGNLLPVSELALWATEEIDVFASCFSRYIASISDVSERLSLAVDGLQIAVSYSSLLQPQGLFLQPILIGRTRPWIDDILRIHTEYLSDVMTIFTSSDTWIMARYYVAGVLTGRNCGIIDQLPECVFLSKSARKFVTLFQSVAEDVAPLVPLQLESSVLKGLVDLFTEYVSILEQHLAIVQKERSISESPIREVVILANLSALMRLTSSIIRNIFSGFHHLDSELDTSMLFVEDVYGRIKASLFGQFMNNMFSPNAKQQREDALNVCDLVPSAPYLELCRESKKLEKMAEEDSIDKNWLMDLLRELVDAVFEQKSSESRIRNINEDMSGYHGELMQITPKQYMLDTQFLIEIARHGGYLSNHVINAYENFASQLEASFISAGLRPARGLNDGEWPTNAAAEALMKLLKLQSVEDKNKSPITKEALNKYRTQFISNNTLEDSDTGFKYSL